MAASVTSLGIALVALLVVTGGLLYVVSTHPELSGLAFPSPSPTPSTASVPIQTSSSLQSFHSWDDVSSFLQASQSAGSRGGMYGSAMPLAAAPMMAAAGTSNSKASSAYSSTNVQVAGVDESDILKTDGTYLYSVSNGQVIILLASPAPAMRILSTLNDSTYSSLFVSGDRLVAFGTDSFDWKPVLEQANVSINETTSTGGPMMGSGSSSAGASLGSAIASPGMRPGFMPVYRPQSSVVKVFDISNRSQPVLLRTLTSQGHVVGSRMIGSRVYVVFNEYPYAPFPRPLYAENGKLATIAPGDISFIDEPFSNYEFTTVVGLDAQDLSQPDARKIVLTGGGQTLFVSQTAVYLAYTKYDYYQPRWQDYEAVLSPILTADAREKLAAIDASDASAWRKDALKVAVGQAFLASLNESDSRPLYVAISQLEQAAGSLQPQESTVVHKFSLGNSIEYVGKGIVPGHTLNQFSLDEENGSLRIATTVSARFAPYSPFASCNTGRTRCSPAPPQELFPSSTGVYVLDSQLNVIGKLEGLAPTESMYAARFIGSRAYLVTFKQLDPLFVVDLSLPTHPVLSGELTLPGYSSYLHPFDGTHLIGLGKDAIPVPTQASGGGELAFPTGLKLSLFDVSNVSAPVELAKYSIGDAGTESLALSDHHAFLFDSSRNLLVLPVQLALVDRSKYPSGSGVHVYGEPVFAGAYVFNVTLDGGFILRGTVAHADNSSARGPYGEFDYSADVERSAFIGETLYTLSGEFVKASDLSTLGEISSVTLPQPPHYAYPFEYSAGKGGASPAAGGVARIG